MSSNESLLTELRPIALGGAAVLARTFVLMSGLGVVLAIAAYLVAGRGWTGVLTALAAFLLSLVAAGLVSIKRAVLTVVREAIVRVRLGERAVGLLFAKLPNAVTGSAQRVPLAQAESMLRNAVGQVLAERADRTGNRAWLARKAQGRAVELVQRVTLAELRLEDQKTGGVDLDLVRERLTTTIQDTLVGRLDATLKSMTVIAASLLAAVCLGGAYLVAYVVNR